MSRKNEFELEIGEQGAIFQREEMGPLYIDEKRWDENNEIWEARVIFSEEDVFSEQDIRFDIPAESFPPVFANSPISLAEFGEGKEITAVEKGAETAAFGVDDKFILIDIQGIKGEYQDTGEIVDANEYIIKEFEVEQDNIKDIKYEDGIFYYSEDREFFGGVDESGDIIFKNETELTNIDEIDLYKDYIITPPQPDLKAFSIEEMKDEYNGEILEIGPAWKIESEDENMIWPHGLDIENDIAFAAGEGISTETPSAISIFDLDKKEVILEIGLEGYDIYSDVIWSLRAFYLKRFIAATRERFICFELKENELEMIDEKETPEYDGRAENMELANDFFMLPGEETVFFQDLPISYEFDIEIEGVGAVDIEPFHERFEYNDQYLRGSILNLIAESPELGGFDKWLFEKPDFELEDEEDENFDYRIYQDSILFALFEDFDAEILADLELMKDEIIENEHFTVQGYFCLTTPFSSKKDPVDLEAATIEVHRGKSREKIIEKNLEKHDKGEYFEIISIENPGKYLIKVIGRLGGRKGKAQKIIDVRKNS